MGAWLGGAFGTFLLRQFFLGGPDGARRRRPGRRRQPVADLPPDLPAAREARARDARDLHVHVDLERPAQPADLPAAPRPVHDDRRARVLPGPVRRQVAGDDGRGAGQPRADDPAVRDRPAVLRPRDRAQPASRAERRGRRRGRAPALEDFRPRQELRVPEHRTSRGRASRRSTPTTTSGSAFGGDWATRPRAGARGGDGRRRRRGDRRPRRGLGRRRCGPRSIAGRRRCPGGSRCSPGLDYARWAEDAAFGETEATRLREGVAAGARGLKVWKLLGLRARDPRGALIPVDDPRLDPLWAAAGELGVPVTIHVADPIAFFRPLDARNERWEELREHPDWHFWPTRPPRRPGRSTASRRSTS